MATVADRYGIAGRNVNYRAMVDETAPDDIYSVGQPHLMYDIGVWCVEQGLNLYIETDGAQLAAGTDARPPCRRVGVITQVSHRRRTSPLLVATRDACLARGPITHAVHEFYKCDPQPFTSACDRMLDDGVRAIDTLGWICGGEAVVLETACKLVGVPDLNLLTATLHFDNGPAGILVASWPSGRQVFRVEMHSPRIARDADPEGVATVYADGDASGVAYETRAVAGSDELYVYCGFQARNREIIDSLAAVRN